VPHDRRASAGAPRMVSGYARGIGRRPRSDTKWLGFGFDPVRPRGSLRVSYARIQAPSPRFDPCRTASRDKHFGARSDHTRSVASTWFLIEEEPESPAAEPGNARRNPKLVRAPARECVTIPNPQENIAGAPSFTEVFWIPKAPEPGSREDPSPDETRDDGEHDAGSRPPTERAASIRDRGVGRRTRRAGDRGKDSVGRKRRVEVRQFVQDHPGTHFRQIVRELGVREGALRHTLWVLSLRGEIRQIRYRHYLLIYPADTPLDRNRFVGSLTEEVAVLIRSYGAVSHRRLQEELRIPRTTLDYHVSKLVGQAAIEVEVRAEGRYYRPSPSDRSGDARTPAPESEGEGSPA